MWLPYIETSKRENKEIAIYKVKIESKHVTYKKKKKISRFERICSEISTRILNQAFKISPRERMTQRGEHELARTCDIHVAPRACTFTFDVARWYRREIGGKRACLFVPADRREAGGEPRGEEALGKNSREAFAARRREGGREIGQWMGRTIGVSRGKRAPSREARPRYLRPISPGSCPRNFSYSNSQPNN